MADILNRFNQMLWAISSVNKALMHVKNEQSFINKVCSIVVKNPGYKQVWIGFTESSGNRSIRLVAQAGFNHRYHNKKEIMGVYIQGGSNPAATRQQPGSNPAATRQQPGSNPAADAIRTGKTIAYRDILNNPKYKKGRKNAVKHGYSSLIALPLKSVNNIFGALLLYSKEVDSFSKDEIKLLEELAFDLSYGIMLIRIREQNKAAEKEIKRIAAFPELNPNPISEVDISGKIHYMNPAFKKIFPDIAENPRKHPWFKNINLFFWALKGKKKRVVKQDIQVQDKYFLQTMVYMPVENTIRTYGIDITPRKKAEDELKRLYEEMESKVQQRTAELIASKHLADIGTLAATVAHELRTPLGVINVAAYNLRKKIGIDDKDMLKHLAIIEKKVVDSGRIINNLLVYSNMKMPQFEKTDIHAILLECADSVKKQFAGYKIRFTNNISKIKGLLIDADPMQITEVFTNIIINAYQSLEEKKGVVEVKSFIKSMNLLEISVKDTGVGISRENMEKIYKPFFTSKTKGTGLGLVICKDMINMHNGFIGIKSKPGKGSIFTVTIPIKRN